MAKTLKRVEPSNIHGSVVVVLQTPDDSEVSAGIAGDGRRGRRIKDLFVKAGFDEKDLMFIHAYPHPRVEYAPVSKADLSDSMEWLDAMIAKSPRKAIIAMGNSAAYAVGITEDTKGVNAIRGRPYKLKDGTVMGATGDPYMLVKEPEKEGQYLSDLGIIRALLKHGKITMPKFKVTYLESAADVKRMYADLLRTKHRKCAYDYETDSNRPLYVTITSVAFCIGQIDGVYQCYIYVPETKLKKNYTKQKRRSIEQALTWFFGKAGKRYSLIAHNAQFDDWITWLKFSGMGFQGSQYDSMIDFWVYDNQTRNGLKELAVFMGYPNYEEEVDQYIKRIVARRGRAIEHEEDFRVAKRFEKHFRLTAVTKKNGDTVYKWPKSKVWNIKTGAWALLPKDVLVRYNCLDVVMTWKGEVEFLQPRLAEEGMLEASAYRHDFARLLLDAEMWGFKLDRKLNRRWSKQLTKIIASSLEQMKDILEKKGYPSDFVENFNPNSSKQLARVLYGEAIPVPQIDPHDVCNALIAEHGMKAREIDLFNVQRYVADFHAEFYADQRNILQAHKAGILDTDGLTKDLLHSFYRRSSIRLSRTISKNLYLGGDHVPSVYTKTGQPSTSKVVVEMLALGDKEEGKSHESDFLYHLLMWRRADKAKSTFVDGLAELVYSDGILRPHYNPIGTNSGRISSSTPNGQNLVKYLRGQCIPRSGNVFVEFDLSQAEIRVIAALSGDKRLLKAIRDADEGNVKGKNVHGLKADTHTLVAAQIYKIPWTEVNKEQRRRTKTVVFGTLYGMTAYRLSKELKITFEEAEEIIEDFFGAFPGVRKWIEKQVEQAKVAPYYAKTSFGTRRSVRNVLSIDQKTAAAAGRVSANMPVQGTAGEYTLWLCAEIKKEADARGLRAEGRDNIGFNNTTHDSGCFEVCKAQAEELVAIIYECATRPAPVEVLNKVAFKVDVEINASWAGCPNLLYAIDPALSEKDGRMRWDLLDPDLLDPVEYEELVRNGYYGIAIKAA